MAGANDRVRAAIAVCKPGHFYVPRRPGYVENLNCAFEFDLLDGKRRMITFEVRHRITNHEADIGTRLLGTPKPKQSTGQAKLGPLAGSHNTVGNIFYGSKAYLAMGDEDVSTYVL